MKDVVIQDVKQPVNILRNCGIWCIQVKKFVSIRAMAGQLNFAKEVTFVVKGLNFGPTVGFSTKAVLRLTGSFWLAQKSSTEMEHPPCSPDLAPNDFWMFPEIKFALKGRRFHDIEDLHKNMTTALKVIP